MDSCKNGKHPPYNIKVANGTTFSADKVYLGYCKGIQAKKATVYLENTKQGLKEDVMFPTLEAGEYLVGNDVFLTYKSVNIGSLKVRNVGKHHVLWLAADKNGKLKANKIQSIYIDPAEDTNGLWVGVMDQNDEWATIKSGTQIFDNFEGELKNVGICDENIQVGGESLHFEKGEGKNAKKVYAVENAD